MIARLSSFALLMSALGACVEPACDGSMLDGPAGLVVTHVEHPTGWGEAACAECHVPGVLHRQACTPDVDLVAVREQVAAEGEASCAACHGDNGVTE